MRRVAALLWLLLSACSTQCGEAYLAELAAYAGDVQRDRASKVGAWTGVARGDRFQVGDGLRTGANGSAELALSSDGVARVEANTLLRFLDRDPGAGGQRKLALEEGVVRIQSGHVELDVHTPRALARVAENSSVRIVADERDLRFDVLVGRVAIEEDGKSSELVAGQQRTLPAASPVVEAPKPTAPQPAPAPEPAPAAEANEPPRPVAEPDAQLTLPELEAMTLHAPSLPLTARLRVLCAGTPTVEFSGRNVPASASGSFVLKLAAGNHAFRVRCDKQVTSQGLLRVQRDPATMELPKSAQRLDVDADGRRYTVRYQNVLPLVNVRWRNARPASGYALWLRRGARQRSFASSKPERTLPPAELSDGDHEFWFESEGGQRSERGTLRIEFDNTARSLSLSEPVEGSNVAGNAVVVSGVALPRSQLSANGVPLAVDAKGRFRAEVPLSADRSVVVRAIHPAAGVHYYVRRVR